MFLEQHRLKPFSDEELDVLIPELAKIGTPIGKQSKNRCFLVEVAGHKLKIFRA